MKQIRISGNMTVTQVVNKIIMSYPNDLIRDIKMTNNIASFLRITKDDTVIKESVQLVVGHD
jgi:hypothetical protein